MQVTLQLQIRKAQSRACPQRLPIAAAQDCPDARRDLAHAERLRNIIIRTDFQSQQTIQFIISCGKHKNRHRAFPAYPAADLPAIDFRKHEIKHKNTRCITMKSIQRCPSIQRRINSKVLLLKILLQNLQQFPIIIYQQNRIIIHRTCHSPLFLPFIFIVIEKDPSHKQAACEKSLFASVEAHLLICPACPLCASMLPCAAGISVICCIAAESGLHPATCGSIMPRIIAR